jgi:hypothetical protein
LTYLQDKKSGAAMTQDNAEELKRLAVLASDPMLFKQVQLLY